MNYQTRAREISDFLNISYEHAFDRLKRGFHHNHALVAKDFIYAGADVNDNDSLLGWYKTTDAYIWELSAYHLEPAFNYAGMCEGISLGMKNTNRTNILNLGDGVGTLSIRMAEDGLIPTYHDLEGSLTASFAQSVFESNNLDVKTRFTSDWEPNLGSRMYDGVIALDFFEHLVNVEDWVRAVHKCLKKGGAFIAQNAFGIGDAEHGNSIPMHLSVNNKYTEEWDPFLRGVGFEQNVDNGWWIKL